MRTITAALAVAAVLITGAPAAHADDQAYLAAVGPSWMSPAKLLRLGNDLCTNLRAGQPMNLALAPLGAQTVTIPGFAEAAQHNLCPDTLGH
jgi:hypothetical protein